MLITQQTHDAIIIYQEWHDNVSFLFSRVDSLLGCIYISVTIFPLLLQSQHK